MKIRNHRKLEYWFIPTTDSDLKGKYTFKYKSSLMRFLNANFNNALNGSVRIEVSEFSSFYTNRHYIVWCNCYEYRNYKTNNLKIVLKPENFRGRKYIHKFSKISKESKKYLAFSDKVINLMCNIEAEDGTILKKDAEKLVKLFYKRGFKDFVPTEEDLEYINGYISEGIPFFHWSDRCNWLRTKTIIEYFKQKNLI